MSEAAATRATVPAMSEIGFFAKQRLVVLRNRGVIDPDVIDDYIARDGYKALAKVLSSYTPTVRRHRSCIQHGYQQQC